MTDKKKFKQKVRERVARTGESYSTARRALDATAGDNRPPGGTTHEADEVTLVRRLREAAAMGDRVEANFSLDDDNGVVIFVDETGDALMADPVHPLFGWGACAMSVPTYRAIDVEWRAMKKKMFRQVTGPLHATTLRKKSLRKVWPFFRAHRFARLGAFGTVATSFDTRFDEEPVVHAMSLTKRFAEVIREVGGGGRVAVVFEESTPEANARVERLFRDLPSVAGLPPALFDFYFAPKALAIPGLEIADFVTYAAGRHVRARLRAGSGETDATDDEEAETAFAAVFRSGPKEPSEGRFIDLTSATVNRLGVMQAGRLVRSALEQPSIAGRAASLRAFPAGAGEPASRLLARYIRDESVRVRESLNLCFGSRTVGSGDERHVWLELDGRPLDITADQFDATLGGVFAPTTNEWHGQWNVARSPVSADGALDDELDDVYRALREWIATPWRERVRRARDTAEAAPR